MTKTLISNVRGPRGEQGDVGPRGPEGPAGPNTLPSLESVAQAVTMDGPARAAVVDTIRANRQSRVPASGGIHGSHTHPQHIYVDGIDYIGGIEGTATGGNSSLVVDVVDHARNLSTRVPVFSMPVDDHSPAAIVKNRGCPGLVLGVGHQVDRSVKVRTIRVDSFGQVSLGDIVSLALPKPPDTDGTTTYIQAHPINASVAAEYGFSDFIAFTRLAWHWYVGVIRLQHATDAVTMQQPWRSFVTFRDPGAAAPGGDQGYLATSQRSTGNIDAICFGHPVNADDRSLYFTSINTVTGDVDGGRANVFTGAGLPLTRRGMELAYKRQPNTNLRCLGVGGLAKRQALIAKWETTSGTTAAVPANNRYKMLTRGNAPTNAGAVIASNGYVSSATRDAYVTPNLGVELYLVPDSTRPASALDVASKWTATGNQRSWRLFIDAAGTMSLSVSPDGSASVTLTSTVALPTTGVRGLGVGYTAASGQAVFYYTTDRITWMKLGATVGSTATAIFNSSTALAVGRSAGTPATLPGIYERFVLRPSWGGATIVDLEFIRGWANGDAAGTSNVDHQGQAWVLQSGVTISATTWNETADLGPTGDPVGYADNIQYIADAALIPDRDDAAMISRRLPGGLARTVIARVQDSGVVNEEVLAESLTAMHFRPRPTLGEGGPIVGSVSELAAYGPTYTTFTSKPLPLWKRGPLTAA